MNINRYTTFKCNKAEIFLQNKIHLKWVGILHVIICYNISILIFENIYEGSYQSPPWLINHYWMKSVYI